MVLLGDATHILLGTHILNCYHADGHPMYVALFLPLDSEKFYCPCGVVERIHVQSVGKGKSVTFNFSPFLIFPA